jgi:hypothetical protein
MESQIFPLLSEYDPVTSSEGSLDPLGLYPIADALAERLVPAVRERQKHPRFLTAMAMGAEICKNFESDAVAADGISPPWQVFEWYVVEGMVRTARDPEEILGVPGTEKARGALKDNVPLSARRYLKNPSVFGFHGVYRVLAENLDIIQDEILGEIGYFLLTTWEKEQKLKGCISNENGEGADIRRQVVAAVQDGLKAKATARSGGWNGWAFFSNHLAPLKCGKDEAEVISMALLDSRFEFRREVILFLVSPVGQEVWLSSGSEREFHQAMKKHGSKELVLLLDIIGKYEEFSRTLQDVFDDCLQAMTKKGSKISLKELARLETITVAQERAIRLYEAVSSGLLILGKVQEFEDSFSLFAGPGNASDWIDRLFEHHFKVQREKPPSGKNPWFERTGDGSFIIRPGYRRDQGGIHDESYLHYYRTNPLWSFAKDLRLIGS